MRRIFFLVCCCISIHLYAQDTTGNPTAADTILNSYNDYQYKQNLDNTIQFMNELEKQRAQKKKQAMIRIGFGVLMLGVLAVGLARKRKKTT